MNGEALEYSANLQRGAHLRLQRRYQESSQFLGLAIAADPERASAYAELAQCLNDWRNHEKKALEAIDRAIALQPTNARYLGLKGWILVCQRKYRRALSVANEAVELDPVDITALNAQANAYTKLGKWKQAEASARRILALDVHDAPALNLLAQALRLQGRGEESREAVDRILALLPNNAFGQMNAGYAAMEVGDHLRANEHFLSSLRMNPHSDLSRQGLLHSLRARVWIYRLHFRYSMFIRRPATFPRFIALVLVVVGMLLLRHLFEWFHPGFGNLFIDLVWFPIIYLNFFSRITGNIFLCFDPVGRRALTRRDKTIAGLFALVLACVLGLAWYSHQRGLFVIMAAFLGTFAYSIYYPQIKDWWQRRKERRLDSGYTASL